MIPKKLPALAAGAIALIAGMQTWVAPTAQARTVAEGSQVVSTGTAVVVTVVDGHGNLVYWWEADGTTTFHKETVAKAVSGGGSWYGPSMLWTGSAVEITATDLSGDIYFWSQPAGTTRWNERKVASSPGSEDGYDYAEIAYTGSASSPTTVIAASTDQAGGIEYWWESPNRTWHPESVVSGGSGVFYGPPVIVATATTVVIASQDVDGGGLESWYQPFDTTAWLANGVSGAVIDSTLANPSIAWTGSAVILVANGAYDESSNSYQTIEYLSQSDGGARWSSEAEVAGGPNEYLYPAVAWTGSNAVITASLGNLNNSLDFWWQGNDTWNRETVAGAAYDAGPFAAVASTGSSVVITDDNANGKFNTESQPFGGTSWTKQVIAYL